jgi:hypothetical protein
VTEVIYDPGRGKVEVSYSDAKMETVHLFAGRGLMFCMSAMLPDVESSWRVLYQKPQERSFKIGSSSPEPSKDILFRKHLSSRSHLQVEYTDFVRYYVTLENGSSEPEDWQFIWTWYEMLEQDKPTSAKSSQMLMERDT